MDKKIRAKMKCESILHHVQCQQISLSAVTADTPENKEWSQWTPTATTILYITNQQAFGAFIPGKEYYVDITPAD